VQIHVGEAAPFSFSGMVKHVFLRGREDQADIQVVLTDASLRSKSSHTVIEELRPLIAQFGSDHQAITKVLEIPPGPPVLATMLAEVYGPDRASRQTAARLVEKIFAAEPSVVDLDTTLRPLRERKVWSLDYHKAGLTGASAAQTALLGRYMFSETSVGILAGSPHPEPINLDLSLESQVRSSPEPFASQSLLTPQGGSVLLSDVLQDPKIIETPVYTRKNLKDVEYVMSELAGSTDAPVYGMLKLQPQIPYPQVTADVPQDTTQPIIKWDGEWFITYEVFRDLGAAFAVVMVLIYILVLGWFQNFALPLIIMAPIPISLIGILPGHYLTGVYFTATSMIGFIAGAGIIVRNSIILIDFIEQDLKQKTPRTLAEFRSSIIHAGTIRFRPMLLTAAAVVVGSSIMLADPIFQGLAVSLIFGEVAATILSRFAVPVLYFWTMKGRVLKD
jgi:multidrug efflux pump subunit AcrB